MKIILLLFIITASISSGCKKSAQKIHQVYAIGDSQTANGVYCRTIDTLLGSNWYVNNKGIQGQTTAEFLVRFSTDVTGHKDAEYVIILGGINDVVTDVTASTIETNLQTMYTAAHNDGIRVIASTLLPFKGYTLWTSTRQTTLLAVNAWILSTAINVDYKIDAYTAFNDPANTGTMLPAYYGPSPDYLHPGLFGYHTLGVLFYNNTTWTPNNTIFDN